jgi:hypothetical protein
MFYEIMQNSIVLTKEDYSKLMSKLEEQEKLIDKLIPYTGMTIDICYEIIQADGCLVEKTLYDCKECGMRKECVIAYLKEDN